MNPNNIAENKSRAFAYGIMRLVGFLQEEKRPFFIIDQVGRSGTSIGANVAEAEHAISKKEFLQKMYIAYKECVETEYWLDLLLKAAYISQEQYEYLHEPCAELERILASITKTTAGRTRNGE